LLDRVISTYGMLFVFLIFLISGVALMGMVNQWYETQDIAQYIARSEGIYGGYTPDTKSAVSQFCQDTKLVNATVTVSDPATFGAPVWAKVSVPFTFQIGSIMTLQTSMPITGIGRSISAYLPGESSVAYTSP
jgi:ABC-type branched-subunit amino acid transport system substrate-binding protein